MTNILFSDKFNDWKDISIWGNTFFDNEIACEALARCSGPKYQYVLGIRAWITVNESMIVLFEFLLQRRVRSWLRMNAGGVD